jgi:hypothetical protein
VARYSCPHRRLVEEAHSERRIIMRRLFFIGPLKKRLAALKPNSEKIALYFPTEVRFLFGAAV